MQSDPVLIEGSDDSDYDDAENWLPDPVDADPGGAEWLVDMCFDVL